uniref:Uncharacterized protein n=1 Tax=viral metagenome TaxID=1070528 RepID=A0A6C0HGX1_9ZZZZ
MGSVNSKSECLQKPGQSGKTMYMQCKIKEFDMLTDVLGGKGALNVVICSNNKKLVEQTSSRMNKDLFDGGSESDSDDVINGSCFSWRSGTRKSNVSGGELANEIKEDRVTMIVCCAHKIRVRYLYNLITDLEKSKLFSRKINIWIDEADESISIWSDPNIDVTHFKKVEKITLVSATFNSVFAKYGRIRMIPLPETHMDKYHKLSECLIEEDCTAGTPTEYFIGVFTKNKGRFSPGTKLFAPGDVTISSHNAIATFLVDQGWSVMVLNGKRKVILIPGKPEIKIDNQISEEEPEEIGKIMTRIYYDNGLFNYPFAVTGQMCISRGLTFQNEEFLFNFGIVPSIGDDATAYQCACRLAGNIKHFPGYRPATLITTTTMKAVILRQEQVATNLARMVHLEKKDDVGEEELLIAGGMAGDELESYRAKKARETKTAKLHQKLTESVRIEEFSTHTDLNARIKALDPRGTSRKPEMSNGYYECSLGKDKKKQDASEVRSWLAVQGIVSWGTGLTNYLKPEPHYGKIATRVYTGYDGDTPTFFLRWVRIPSKEEL